MGKTISLYSPSPIDLSDFLSLLNELGGKITNEADLDGHLLSDEGYVYFYMARLGLAGEIEAFGEDVEAKLGQPVRSSIDLHLSHDEGSQPLALRFAQEFARRWSAVATGAVYTAMTIADIDRLRAVGAPMPSLLARDVELVLTASPSVDDIIGEFGGLCISHGDTDLMESAERALRKLENQDLDSTCETISWFIPFDHTTDIWIVLCMDPGHWKEGVCGVCDAILQHLGQSAQCRLRLVHGHSDSEAVEHLTLAIAERILRAQQGVMVGVFSFVFDADELAQAIRTGNRFQLR